MIETARICRKKFVLWAGMLLIASVFVFLHFSGFTVEKEKEYRISQKEYVSEYPSYIQGILQSAGSLNQISVFAQQDSFATKNIEKTKEDYEKMEDISLGTFDGRCLVTFFTYSPIRFVTLLFTLLVAFLLSEKQSEGMEGLIFSCKKGRLQFCIRKFCALALTTVGFTVICYGIFLSICYLSIRPKEGIDVFFYSIQSLEIFRDYIGVQSIWQVLIFYVGMQCIINIFCGFLLFSLRMLDQTKLWGSAFFTLVFILEYGLYKVIDETSLFAVLKYINLFYLLQQGFGFFEYKNFWIGKSLMNKQMMIEVILGAGIGCTFLITNLVTVFRYPNSSKKIMCSQFEKWKEKKYAIFSKWMEKNSLLGMELCKTLLFQKGWLIFVLLCFWGYRTLDYTSISFSVAQQNVMDFVVRHSGTITTESEAELAEMNQTLKKAEKEYKQAMELYNNKELSEDGYLAALVKYESYADTMETYKILSEKTEYLKQLKKERGIDGWYIKEGAYAYLLGFQQTGNAKAIVFPLGLFFLCSFIFRFERRNGMLPVIFTTTNGKEDLRKVKRNTIAVLTFVVCSFMFFFEILNVSKLYGIEGLQAPVQSISQFEHFPVRCTMGMFLVGNYVLRYIALFVCTYMVARMGEWKRWN